jgi:predicted nucleic acid-binding Zn ribbon protein
VRRLGPRPLRSALAQVRATAAPAGLLARVQAAWPEVAGPAIAAEAEPSAERDGVVTVSCRSAVWAHELGLMSADLQERLNGALSDPSGRGPIAGLRFLVASADRRR